MIYNRLALTILGDLLDLRPEQPAAVFLATLKHNTCPCGVSLQTPAEFANVIVWTDSWPPFLSNLEALRSGSLSIFCIQLKQVLIFFYCCREPGNSPWVIQTNRRTHFSGRGNTQSNIGLGLEALIDSMEKSWRKDHAKCR